MHAPAVRGDAEAGQEITARYMTYPDGCTVDLAGLAVVAALRMASHADMATLGRVAEKLRAQIGGTMPVLEGYEPIGPGLPLTVRRRPR